MAKRKEKKRNHKRKIIYIIACTIFALPIVIVLISAILSSSNTAVTPLILCLNQTGNCSSNDYKSNVGCFVNDSLINSNGGKPCTTNCKDDIYTYTCKCPLKKTWDGSLLTCTTSCLNETIDCITYTSGNHCVHITDTNNGTECTTLCNNTVGSFKCKCLPGYEWDKMKLVCALICLNQTGNCLSGDYKANVGCVVNDSFINSNGGKSCTTNCKDDIFSYYCECPDKKAWDSSLLTCTMSCLNETIDCSTYTSGNHCVPIFDTNNELECTTVCNNTVGSFECKCKPGKEWFKKNLRCDLPCANANAMACNNISNNSSSCMPSPNLENAYNCLAYCPINGTNLDYNCLCENKYKWHSKDHICISMCMNKSTDCSEFTPISMKCYLTDTTLYSEPFDCQHDCTNGILSYICNCNLPYLFFPLKCALHCPIIELFSNYYSQCINEINDKSCFHDTYQTCKGGCFSNKLDYICDCTVPATYWDFIEHFCKPYCKTQTNADCDPVTINNHKCLSQTPIANTNFICYSTCDATTGNIDYYCECKAGYRWNYSMKNCL